MKAQALCLLAALVSLMPMTTRAADVKPAAEKKPINQRVDVEAYDKLRANKEVIILDVRTAEEFKTGHVPGATNLSVNSPGFDEAVAKLDKSKTYLVNCAVGMRSAKACKKLEAAGFQNLYDLAPGFDGWKKAGKPVEK